MTRWRDFIHRLQRKILPEPKRPTFPTVDYSTRWAERRDWMHSRGVRDIRPIIKPGRQEGE